jgi:hypothetical protein
VVFNASQRCAAGFTGLQARNANIPSPFLIHTLFCDEWQEMTLEINPYFGSHYASTIAHPNQTV